MPFVTDELEVLAAKAAEYKLISDLATDPVKRQQYGWLAQELRDLIKKVEAQRTQPPPDGAIKINSHTDKR